MRTHVVTGSEGGCGLAIRKYLEAKGDKVIGVDLKGADVNGDLSSVDGRNAMVAEVAELCGGKLDGVVANAGVLHAGGLPGSLVTSVNYFGAVATLEGFRPMLAKSDSPRAVVTGSNSMAIIPVHKQLLELYAAGDEEAARALSDEIPEEPGVYGTSKFGIAQWVRENAIKPEWIGNGIALSVIAPGLIDTPLSTEEQKAAILEMGDDYPVPAGRSSTPDEIATLVGYLLSEDAGMMCGSLIFVDGGTEATLRRSDTPAPSGYFEL